MVSGYFEHKMISVDKKVFMWVQTHIYTLLTIGRAIQGVTDQLINCHYTYNILV